MHSRKMPKITYDGDKVTVTAANEFEITFKVDKNVINNKPGWQHLT